MKLPKVLFYFVIILNFCAPIKSFCQNPQEWGLQKLDFKATYFSDHDHLLISKVKYNTHNQRIFLYNTIPYTRFDISINQLDTAGYNTWNGNSYISVGVDSIDSPFGSSLNEIHRIYGSVGSYARDFETDNDDNFVIIADNADNPTNSWPNNSASVHPPMQILILKVGLDGNTIWHKMYGGSKNDLAISIKKLNDGNFIVLGQTESNDGDILNYYGGRDILLLKIDGNTGNIIWQKNIGSSVDELPTHLEIANDGSLFISGSAMASTLFPSSYNGLNAFLMKTNSQGDIVWKKVFAGDGNDEIKSFVTTNDGGFVSIGVSNSNNGNYLNNVGGNDIFIFRHSNSGDIIWTKRYGNQYNDEAGDIAIADCDSLIYASFSNQYGVSPQSYNTYPSYAQTPGNRVVLYYNGIEKYNFHEMLYLYGTIPNGDNYMAFYTTSNIISNKRGGILTASNEHKSWGSTTGYIGRSFLIEEFGIPRLIKYYDTSICKGQPAFGQFHFKDSTFNDTLRNACLIDTLVRNIKVHVINGDSIILKDTTICYGGKYKNISIYSSFIDTDTFMINTSCGNNLIYKKTNVKLASFIKNNFGKDSVLCKEKTIILNPYKGAFSYLWQDSSSQSNYSVSNPGLYWVEVKDSTGCIKRDSISITASDLYLTLPNELTLTLPNNITIYPQTNGNVTWISDPTLSCMFCQNVIASPKDNIVYYLNSTKKNCEVKGKIKVNVFKNFYLYIPNTFTPNHDNKNDLFRVLTNYSGFFQMEIFNRYGQRLFITNSQNEGWNGRYNGLEQKIDNYIYLIKYENENGKIVSNNGSFVLIR